LKTYSSVGETKESKVIYMKYIDSKKIFGITNEGGLCTYVLKPYYNESNPQLPFTFEA